VGVAAVRQRLHLCQSPVVLANMDARLRRVHLIARAHGGLERDRCHLVVRNCQLAAVALLGADSLLQLDALEEPGEVGEAEDDDT